MRARDEIQGIERLWWAPLCAMFGKVAPLPKDKLRISSPQAMAWGWHTMGMTYHGDVMLWHWELWHGYGMVWGCDAMGMGWIGLSYPFMCIYASSTIIVHFLFGFTNLLLNQIINMR